MAAACTRASTPPAPKATSPLLTRCCFTICDEYNEIWLREERGLAERSIYALMGEGRTFLTWQLDRCGIDSLMEMSVGDIDRCMDMRSLHQTRKSVKDVAERLRSLLRYLHWTRRTAIDMSPHVIGPLLYAYEGVPSILERDQIAAVLETASKDTTPIGLRDQAILQLLATYGLRSGEIRNLKIEDIDWRTESIRILHTKTRACSYLPLMAPVGEAILAYLRSGRPQPTPVKCSCGPVRPMEGSGCCIVPSSGESGMPGSSHRESVGHTSSDMPARSRCCAPRSRKR